MGLWKKCTPRIKGLETHQGAQIQAVRGTDLVGNIFFPLLIFQIFFDFFLLVFVQWGHRCDQSNKEASGPSPAAPRAVLKVLGNCGCSGALGTAVVRAHGAAVNSAGVHAHTNSPTHIHTTSNTHSHHLQQTYSHPCTLPFTHTNGNTVIATQIHKLTSKHNHTRTCMLAHILSPASTHFLLPPHHTHTPLSLQ